MSVCSVISDVSVLGCFLLIFFLFSSIPEHFLCIPSNPMPPKRHPVNASDSESVTTLPPRKRQLTEKGKAQKKTALKTTSRNKKKASKEKNVAEKIAKKGSRAMQKGKKGLCRLI